MADEVVYTRPCPSCGQDMTILAVRHMVQQGDSATLTTTHTCPQPK